jgi:hypothetical protein
MRRCKEQQAMFKQKYLTQQSLSQAALFEDFSQSPSQPQSQSSSIEDYLDDSKELDSPTQDPKLNKIHQTNGSL